MEIKTPPITKECSTKRYKDGKVFSFNHPVAIEEPLEIRISDEPFVTLMRSPSLEKELVIGFCFTEGLIKSISDVLLLEHCGTASEAGTHNVAKLRLSNAEKILNKSKRNIEARTACGICSRATIGDICSQIAKIDSDMGVKIEVLRSLDEKMLEAQKLFNLSGATHAAALFTKDGELVVCAEDLGRHNALDKIIGYCLIRGIPTQNKVVVLSGRTSFELVMKAARAGIPIIASVSAPTLFAVELSQALGCTLVGFLRKEGFNIYTYPDRIKDV